MKSIFDQYKALNEGKLNESQFLRNVKMALPKFISNTTTFKDAVKILKNKGIITEAKSADPMYQYDPQQYDLGMRYELDKGTDEEKASKIVCKNLEEDAAYYTNLHLAGYDEDAMKANRKKRTDLDIEVKKDNFVDTANGVKKVKLDKLTEDEMIVLVGNVLNEISFSQWKELKKKLADLKADTTEDHSEEIAAIEKQLAPKYGNTSTKVDNSWVANFYDKPSTGRGGSRYKGD